MKKTKKLLSLVCALALAMSVVPAALADDENSDVLLNADFEPVAATLFERDFEATSGIDYSMVTFENGYAPYTTIDSDDAHGRYAIVDAGMYWHSERGLESDWVNGGWLFDEAISSGSWTISFDFNMQSGGGYSNVSLAAANVKGNEYSQFRLLGADGDNVLVNQAALTGTLSPVKGNWYHYEMKLNKSANTYEVTISDGANKATGSGTISQTYAFDGLMFGAGMKTYIDNINISGEKVNAPEYIGLPDGTQSQTYTIQDGYAIIDDTQNGWSYGGYKFKNAMDSDKYEISFDFNIMSLGSTGYGSVYLTDEDHGGNSQIYEFRLINIKDFDGVKYFYGTDPEGGSSWIDVDYNENTWYNYKMVVDNSTKEYTATITNKATGASGSRTLKNFPTKNINVIMFGTKTKIAVDNILVQKFHENPKVSKVEFTDESGAALVKATPETAAVKIYFDEAMDADSLKGAVKVFGMTAGEASLSSDGKVYTILVENILSVGTNIRVTVSADAKSQYNKNLEENFLQVYNVGDPNVLLDIDYDSAVPELGRFDGTATDTYPEENGNKYMNIKTSYTGNGYKLSREIPNDGGNYSVAFDFSLPELTNDNTRYLCLNELLPSGNDSAEASYNQLGLLRTSGGKFYLNGEALVGSGCEKDVWYSYKLNFNRATGNYTVLITKRGDSASVAGSASGKFKDEDYSDGMRYDKTYNSIKFHFKNTINIDNIKVVCEDKKPVLSDSSVQFIDNGGNKLSGASMLTDKIAIDFGAFINGRSVNDDSVTLLKGEEPVSFKYSVSGSKLILSDMALEGNTTYEITVSNKITGVDGTRQDSDLYDWTYEFTTGSNTVTMTLNKLTNESGDITEIADGDVNVIIDAVNTLTSANNAYLISAYYADDNRLLNLDITNVSVPSGTNGQISVPVKVSKPDGCKSVKFLLWKSLSEAKPASAALAY